MHTHTCKDSCITHFVTFVAWPARSTEYSPNEFSAMARAKSDGTAAGCKCGKGEEGQHLFSETTMHHVKKTCL